MTTTNPAEYMDELRTARQQKDEAYRERDACVAMLARMALMLGWRAGTLKHEGEWEEDWRTIVFVDTPTGQLSWHFHDSEKPLVKGLTEYPFLWDGHTSEEKYGRMRNLPYLVGGRLRCGRCLGSMGIDDTDVVCMSCGCRVSGL